jgi:hypothetical protein
MPCSFHRAMIYLALYLYHSYRWSLFLYIVILAQYICAAWDFLLITSGNGVMTKIDGAATKPRASCELHTWLCCSARAGIMISSCNPLWDYINVLSWHNLFTLCEILYWCQFGDGVMIKDLWCRSETESSLWMRTRDCATRRMLVSRYLVMIHYGTTLIYYLSWTFPLKRFFCCLLKQSNNICHHYWIKRVYNSDVFFK